MHTNWNCIAIATHRNLSLLPRVQSLQQQWRRKCEDNVLCADGRATWRRILKQQLQKQLQKQHCIKVAQLLILKLNRFYYINTHIRHIQSGATSLQPPSKTISISALSLNSATNYSYSDDLRRADWGSVVDRLMNQLNAAIKSFNPFPAWALRWHWIKVAEFFVEPQKQHQALYTIWRRKELEAL